MVQSLQKIVDKQDSASEEEEDIEDEQVRFNFVTPEGLPLPGIFPEDSAFAKIEGLRLYLEGELGTDTIVNAYSYLCDPPEGEDDNEQLKIILGVENVKFIPLIYQLIVYEDNYFQNTT